AFQQMGTQVRELPGPEAARMRRAPKGALPTEVLVRASEPGAKILIKPVVEEGGRKLDVVEMIDKDGESTTMWLDAATHLLVKVGEQDGVVELSDWRDVSGIKYPFKVHVKGNQGTVDFETEEVKINSGLSPELFKR